jgi:hypothetical protein
MTRNLARGLVPVTVIILALPPSSLGQPKPVPVARTEASEFNAEEFDAILRPIVLYQVDFLAQTLMASTYPVHVAAAFRWLEKGGNKNLNWETPAKALENESWDPRVKIWSPSRT